MPTEPHLSREQRRALERQHRRQAEKDRKRLRAAGASGAALTIAGMLVGGAAQPAWAAADYTVDNPTDTHVDGQTTLREAVEQANAAPGLQTIDFAEALRAQEITLLAQIPITDSVTITGFGGSDGPIIDGGDTDGAHDRIFYMHNPDSPLNITISDLTMQDGDTTQQTNADSRGGAILDIGENLTLSNLDIHANHAGNDGGAVFVDPEDGATLTIQDSSLTGNTNDVTASEPSFNPPFDGGAVAVNSNDPSDTATATIAISGSTFLSNTADGGDGGGVSVSNIAGSVTVDGQSSFGHFGIGNKPVQGNNATGGRGGGIAVVGRPQLVAEVVAAATTGLTVDIDDSLFLANQSGEGGGVFLSNVDTAGMDTDTFMGNQAIGGSETTGDGGGAALRFVADGTITDNTFGGDPPFESNHSSHNGGALAVRNSTVDVAGSSLLNNDATSYGGALYANDGTLNIGTSTISGNTARYGGGVYFGGYEYSPSYQYNPVAAASISHLTATVTDTEISGNTAQYSGGGISSEYASIQVTGSVISGNTATQRDGGGISAAYVQLDIASSTITGNSADSDHGGGVYLENSTGSITGSVISNNSAYYGGGVSLYGVNGTEGPFTIATTTIDGNSAIGDGDGEGGGVWLYDTDTNFIESTISNNESDADGGGIYAEEGSSVSTVNTTVSNNTSDQGLGGGIWSDSPVSLDETTIVDNEAELGGDGVYDNSGGTINNSIVANNDASTNSERNSEDLSSGIVVVEGQVFTAAFSLIENPNSVLTPQSHDNITATDPDLGPLQDNGGPLTGSALNSATRLPTFTHHPNPTSPVIDAGDPAYDPNSEQSPYAMPNHDQRQLTRPVAIKSATAIVDMGAVEVQAAPPPPPPPPPPPASPSPSANPEMRYVALDTPTRVLDTRNGTGAPAGLKTGDVTFDLSSVLPANANGVVLNVTVTGSDHNGHVLGFADGSPYPPTSNVNFVTGQTQANEAIIKVPASRKVVLSIFGAHAHLVADVVGYFVPGDPSGANRVTTRTPTRIFDSRETPTVRRTGEITLDLNGLVPAGSTSAVLNITATGGTGGGFIVAYPAGTTKPGTSNVNYRRGSTQANEAFVRLGTGANAGKVTLFVDGSPASVIVNLVGTVDPGPGTATELGTPFRALDTRVGTGGPTGRVLGDIAVTMPAEVPANATGVILNVTEVAATGPGHFVVFATGSAAPPTSTLDFIDGHAVANEVLTAIGPGKKVTVRVVGHSSHVVVDVMGFVTP